MVCIRKIYYSFYKNSDITLSAITNQKESEGTIGWEGVEELKKNTNNSSEEYPDTNKQEQWYKNTLKVGNGAHHLYISKKLII